MADLFKYREIRALLSARIQDSGDADEFPDRVLLNGYATLTPNYRGGSVVFTEAGEYAIPRSLSARVVDGRLMTEVLDEDDAVLQPLFLPVTVDERANQFWSWTLTFNSLSLGAWGEDVSHPPLSFPVPDGEGPLELSTVATQTAHTSRFITRGEPGAGLTEIVAEDGELVFTWDNGNSTTIDVPDAVPGPPGAGIPQTIDADGTTITLSDGGGSITIPSSANNQPDSLMWRNGDGRSSASQIDIYDPPTAARHAVNKSHLDYTMDSIQPGLLGPGDRERIDNAAPVEYVDSAAIQLARVRPSAVVTYGTTAGGVAYHLVEVPGGPVPSLATNHYVEPPAIGGEPAVKNIGEMARERGGSIIFNSHGHGTTRIWGPVIKGGQALQEFQAGSRGSEALGFYSDGTAGVFKASRGDTAASMVSEGVMECFSFGPILVEGGEPRDVDNDPVFSNLAPLSARQILGVKEDGSLFLATTEGSTGASGLGGTDTALFAESLGAYHAIMLDGGGSAQTLVNGNQIHLSSDAGFLRAVPAVGEIRAFVPAVDSGWHALSYASGVVAVQENRRISGRVRNGRVQLYGAAQPRDGFVPGQWLHVTTLPAWMRPSVPNLVWLPCATDTGQSGTASVSGGNGQVQVKVSAFGEGLEPSYVDLSGLTFEARW